MRSRGAPILRVVAVMRVLIGTAALVRPELVRVATGGGPLDADARAFTRMIGARDVVLGAGVLGGWSRPDLQRAFATAGAIADLVDCGASLAVAATVGDRRHRRWLALAASGAISASVSFVAIFADGSRTS